MERGATLGSRPFSNNDIISTSYDIIIPLFCISEKQFKIYHMPSNYTEIHSFSVLDVIEDRCKKSDLPRSSPQDKGPIKILES